MKRHPHLQPLSDDHHGALVLARRTRLAAKRCRDRGELANLWEEVRRRFALELEPHFRVEEELLFPHLDAAGARSEVQRARADHARLRELVGVEPDPGVAMEFAELLHRHVRFEERELFPRAESLLALPVLEAAGRAAIEARRSSTPPPGDAVGHVTAGEKHPGPARARDVARQLTEAVRNACIDAALDGYERASISGLCHEGAWEAAVSAIRMLALDALAERAVDPDPEGSAAAAVATERVGDITLRLAKRFASPGPPAAGSAAAATGAIAAGILEWTAALSALRGPEGFRKRARSIASRATALQSSLSAAAQTDAEVVERWMALRGVPGARPEPRATVDAPAAATDSVLDVATRCAQVATLAAEVARDGHGAARPDAAAALQLAASAALCALALAEENLRSAVETDWTRSTKRQIWRTRLVVHRARPAAEDGGSEEPLQAAARSRRSHSTIAAASPPSRASSASRLARGSPTVATPSVRPPFRRMTVPWPCLGSPTESAWSHPAADPTCWIETS